jgi:hypothetical protein
MAAARDEAGSTGAPTLVSCLCVTEGRAAFMPWLLWSFDRQTWPHRELVIVDSSPQPFQSSRTDVRVHHVAPGTNIPDKRNQALALARGSLVAWFDDDDWQHPERLDRLVRALTGGAFVAGGTRSWFVDLHGHGCRTYDGERAIIFNGAGFRRELAASVPFDVARRRASDSVWMQAITARAASAIARVDSVPLAIWLCHGQNISNPRTRGSYPVALDVLRQQVGEAWKDTDQQLERLRLALPAPIAGPAARPLPILDGAATSTAPSGLPEGDAAWARDPRGRRTAHSRLRRAAMPPVEAVQHTAPRLNAERPPRRGRAGMPLLSAPSPTSFVVFVSAGDAAHAPVIVPHLIQQARHPFTEILAVIDGAAPGGSELGGALDTLVHAGAVDRVLAYEVRIGSDGGNDGGRSDSPPGLSRLRALPARALAQALGATNGEFVVVAAAHQLIHAAPGDSWVQQAIRALDRTPDLLLVEPHPGPHAGAPGTARSLGSHAAGRSWDAALRAWRAPTLVGQPFVAHRERLLRALRAGDPLSDASFEAALNGRTTAAPGCAILDSKGVWAVCLRGARMGAAITQLRDTIEEGLLPPSRGGSGELIVDDPAALHLWQGLRPIPSGSYEPSITGL